MIKGDLGEFGGAFGHFFTRGGKGCSIVNPKIFQIFGGREGEK